MVAHLTDSKDFVELISQFKQYDEQIAQECQQITQKWPDYIKTLKPATDCKFGEAKQQLLEYQSSVIQKLQEKIDKIQPALKTLS